MRPILYATLASAAFLGAGECALADSFVDRSPLFADVDPSSPGVETIIPCNYSPPWEYSSPERAIWMATKGL
jgi:hypothetical protein